jgi:beta-lactamase class A
MLVAILAAACSGSAPSRRTPARAPLAIATAALPTGTPAPSEVAIPSPTAQQEQCPEPYVTPVASPTLAAAGESANAGTPVPTPPIRIAHAMEIPPLPSPTAARTAAPAPPQQRADATLERLIRDRLGAEASHYAIVIEDLGDGRRVALDPDRVFYAASLFKLEVMYEIFRQREAGVLDFGEEYVASDYYSSFDLGPHLVAPCARVSVRDLLAAMMSVSDNVAAVMLQDRAGAGNINDAMAALGLGQTRLTEDGTLPATAGDIARFVETIARGEAVSRDASKEMADLMATEQLDDRIPARLPEGTRVEHKTANWDNATHDAGIVHGKKSTYVMVLMSDIGSGGDAARTEADIAQIAFDYFEQ